MLGKAACTKDGKAMLNEAGHDKVGEVVLGEAARQDPCRDLARFLQS